MGRLHTRRRLAAIAAVVTAAATAVVGITLTASPALAAGTGSGYLHTSGRNIVDANGTTVRLTGINWFGMETDNHTFHGLWAGRNATWRMQIDHMAQIGFNTIRVPYTGDSLRPGAVATSINTDSNADLIGMSPLQILDQVVNYAGSKGMRIILDRHRPTAAGQTPLWTGAGVSEASTIADWQMLASRYANNPTVIGADLFNEPHGDGWYPTAIGACWGCGDTARDWRLAAERIGNAVLQTNPNWLILVEGVSTLNGSSANLPAGASATWWGGNLSQAIAQPVRLNVANRLVYSPHEYGLSVYPGSCDASGGQKWFADPTFPNNLPAVWDNYWGNIAKQNVAPILVGEFGSTLACTQDVTWLNSLMSYLTTNGMSFTYWAWNPNSGDTGGVVSDDWVTENAQKVSILRPHLVPPVGGGTQTSAPPTTSRAPTSAPPTTSRAPTSAPPTTSRPPTSAPPTSAPPTTGSTGACSATYSINNSWPGGFSALVTVKAGTAAINGWTVRWTFANGQTITQLWQGALTTSGSAITVKNLDYNGNLAANATTQFGFNGAVSGTNSVPTLTCTSP